MNGYECAALILTTWQMSYHTQGMRDFSLLCDANEYVSEDSMDQWTPKKKQKFEEWLMKIFIQDPFIQINILWLFLDEIH